VDKFNKKINAALAEPKIMARCRAGCLGACGLADDFGKLVDDALARQLPPGADQPSRFRRVQTRLAKGVGWKSRRLAKLAYGA
jgi:hypothetical protein